MPTLDAVERTALLTAALRAAESRRPDRLYADPYAAAFAGDVGPELLAEVRAVTFPAGRSRTLPSTPDYNAIRTRFFDDYLTGAVRDQAMNQVVLAPVGMDARAYRLRWPQRIRLFELDRPAVLAVKDELLGDTPERAAGVWTDEHGGPCDEGARGLRAQEGRRREQAREAPGGARQSNTVVVDRSQVGVDLRDDDWTDRLLAAGYDPTAPSTWLLEGLLYYIPEPDVHRILGQVRAMTAPGSLVAADVVNRAALRLPNMRGLLDVFAGWGCPWLFGTDEPEDLFARHGVAATAVQPGEPAADYGRWPDPVPPRAETEVRRVFFVHGRRTGD